jgi:hypothetical protein
LKDNFSPPPLTTAKAPPSLEVPSDFQFEHNLIL